MDITEIAPAREASAARPVVTWWWLVAASVLVLALAAGTLAAWWVATRETRTTTYRVLGDIGALRLDLGDADVEIDGGATAVEVRRVDRFAFGKPANERRTVQGDNVSIVSRCPDQVVGACRAAYRLTVPDNVPLVVETSSGDVRLTNVRASVQVSSGSGAIAASGYCGFSLRANSDSGDITATSECSPERMELRSRSGDVHAILPAARYQLDAQSDTGTVRTRGLTIAEDAGFQVQALSASGDVTVEATT